MSSEPIRINVRYTDKDVSRIMGEPAAAVRKRWPKYQDSPRKWWIMGADLLALTVRQPAALRLIENVNKSASLQYLNAPSILERPEVKPHF